MPSRKNDLRPHHAFCLVSAHNPETDEWLVREGFDPGGAGKGPEGRRGSMSVAVTHAISQIEKRPGPWLVMAISHPQLILTDLAGGRRRYVPDGRLDDRKKLALQLPESQMLARIGRLDLLPPSLWTERFSSVPVSGAGRKERVLRSGSARRVELEERVRVGA